MNNNLIEYTSQYIEGITDKAERLFALLAYTEGLEVRESEMIGSSADGHTVPDFVVLLNKRDKVYIEITAGSVNSARKKRQLKIMLKSGLNYVQLTEKELTEISINGESVSQYILHKLA